MVMEHSARAEGQPPVRGPGWLHDVLRSADVAWCQLRHAPDAPNGGQDVDLLVTPSGIGAVAATLSAQGFVRAPTPRRGTRRVYVRPGSGSENAQMIDTVTDLTFGPYREVTTSLAPGVLDRRLPWPDGAWTPSPPDAFWLLLAHALLDKGRVASRHRERLLVLAGDASATDPAATFFDAAAPHGVTAATLLADVRASRWDAAEAAGPPLLTALRAQQWPAWWVRAQWHRALRRAPASMWRARLSPRSDHLTPQGRR
jgi:hypothetical protein